MQISEISLPDLPRNDIVQIPDDAVNTLYYNPSDKVLLRGWPFAAYMKLPFFLLCASADWSYPTAMSICWLLADALLLPHAPVKIVLPKNKMHLIITNQIVN